MRNQPMSIRPVSGGVSLNGETVFGDYAIHLHRDHDGPVYDGDGKELGTVRLAIKTPPEVPAPPPVLTTEQKHRMAERLKVCEPCEHNRGVRRVTVKCARCKTCAGKSLISESSVCPEGKWSA